MMSYSAEKPKKYEERLADAFAFDETDLEANRAGKLTLRQMHQIEKARKRGIALWALLLIIGVPSMLICLAISAPAFGSIEIVLPYIIGIFVMMGAYGYGKLNSRSLEADMRDPQIAVVEGPVELIVAGAQYGVTYMMKLDGKQFPLKKDAFFALKNSDPYRIYYAERSKQLLSVEWLREGDENRVVDDRMEAKPLDAAVNPKHKLQ